MKVTLTDGNVAIVKWRYSDISYTSVEMIETLCRIKIDFIVFEGLTTKSAGDNHNKSIARKISLTRALTGFSKEDKKLVWKQYEKEMGF